MCPNSYCEAGEDCTCADCSCSGGTSCVDGECVLVSNLWPGLQVRTAQ